MAGTPRDQAPALPDIAYPNDPVQVSEPPAGETPLSGPRFALLPETVRLGEPLTVAYSDVFTGPGSRDFRAVLIDSKGRRVLRASFFGFTGDGSGREVLAAVMGIPSTVEPGAFIIRVEASGRTVQDLPFVVGPRSFVSETISLDENNTDIRTRPDPQKTLESERLWAILSGTGRDIYTPGPFTPPVTSTRRTSSFGDRRLYQYADGSTDTSIHAGVDYGVPTGTEVRSCGAGKVVLARFRIVTGNSVVIEHLPGVYSLYYHLDKIEVEEGSEIPSGWRIGLSGATGLATGPHLHWEIRAAGENTDPDAFISRTVLDKTEILSKLKAY
jgi:hypothetical protein